MKKGGRGCGWFAPKICWLNLSQFMGLFKAFEKKKRATNINFPLNFQVINRDDRKKSEIRGILSSLY